MSEFLIDAGELASFMAGRAGLLLIGGLEGARFETLGLELWHGRGIGKDCFLISRTADAAATGAVALMAPPAAILAVAAAEPEDWQPWRQWFAADGGDQIPEFILVDDAPAAIVKSLLARERRAVAASADLQIELVQLRQDLEQTQAVTAGFVRALSYRPAAPLQLLAPVEPGDEQIRLDAERPWLLQPLGSRLDRIGALAIHLAAAQIAPADHLRVRLSGIETGRVCGSWLIPAEALQPGWLTLELPTPIAWGPQTAQLEFHMAALGEDSAICLSANRAQGFELNQARRPGHELLPHELAVKIWCAEPATRFVAAAYWDATELGLFGLPSGIALAMPMSAYAGLRVVGGRLAQDYDPASAVPLMLETSGRQQTLLIFPFAFVAAMDIAEIALGLRVGDLRQLAASLWLQPVGRAINSEDDLLVPDSAVAWTGWFGWGGRGDLKLSLAIPPAAGSVAQLVLAIDHPIRRKPAISLIELQKITLFAINDGKRARRMVNLIGEPWLRPVASTAHFGREPARIWLGGVILNEHFDNQTSYRHLDFSISEFQVDEFFWSSLKFRLVVDQRRPCLEFRDIPAWPPSLRHWPFDTAEESGRLARFFGDEPDVGLVGNVSPIEDLALIHGLVQSLPAIVAKALTLFAISDVDAAQWQKDTEQLCARLESLADLLPDR